jgi:hypothetical protein
MQLQNYPNLERFVLDLDSATRTKGKRRLVGRAGA